RPAASSTPRGCWSSTRKANAKRNTSSTRGTSNKCWSTRRAASCCSWGRASSSSWNCRRNETTSSWSEPSIEEAVDFPAEAGEHARLGDADGVGGEGQGRRDFPRRLALQHHHPERPPGRRLELRLEEFQQ